MRQAMDKPMEIPAIIATFWISLFFMKALAVNARTNSRDRLVMPSIIL